MIYFINKLSVSSKIGICMMSSVCSLGTMIYDNKKINYNCESMIIKNFKEQNKEPEKEIAKLIYWLSLQ